MIFLKRLFGMVLCILFFITACGTEETSTTEQKNGGGTEDRNPLMMNNLISSYNTIELKESLDASLQQNIFKKDGFPNGYELSVNPSAKEAVLIIRPVSEKNYPSLESTLEKNMNDALGAEESPEYRVKVIPLWNGTNQTSRQFHEEVMINDIVYDMKQFHQIDVMTGIQFSETDGRIVSIDLTFMANGAEIADPNQINQYSKEFFRLAEEKGLKTRDISIFYVHDGKEEWKTKVIPAVNKGLKEMEDLQVTSVTILHESAPIMVNTSLNSTDEKAKDIGKRIETLVHEFLQYQPIKQYYSGSIGIQVLSADQQKINE